MGIGEIGIILLVALLVIRPKQMPEIAFALGRFLRSMQQTFSPVKEELNRQFKLGELDHNRKRADEADKLRRGKEDSE